MYKGEICVFIICALVFFSCHNHEKNIQESLDKYAVTPLDNGVFRGGVLRLNETSNITNLHPLKAISTGEKHLLNQVLEGLVKMNPVTLELEPALAKSWDISADGLSYVFYLRGGVNFHSSKLLFGSSQTREFKAQDAENALNILCASTLKDPFIQEFQQQVGSHRFTAINDSVLTIKIMHKNFSFLNMLLHSKCKIYPKEYETVPEVIKPFIAIGTGPFYIREMQLGIGCSLSKNTWYWKKDALGNPLPYLNEVHFYFNKDLGYEFSQFRAGKLDVILNLDLQSLDAVVHNLEEALEGKNIPMKISVSPLMSSVNLFYNPTASIFKSISLKKAINNAIDREKIANYALLGDAKAANNSIIPPFFQGYRSPFIDVFKYDSLQNKKRRSQAIISLNGLSKLYIKPSSNEEIEGKIALELAGMLRKKLSIPVEVLPTNFVVNAQQPILFLKTVTPQYPDPIHYIEQIYRQAVSVGVDSKQEWAESFMLLLEDAKRLPLSENINSIVNLESWLIENRTYIPVIYKESTMAMHYRVQNFPNNALNYLDLTKTYVSY